MKFNNKYDERVPRELFVDDHYLGRPADFADKIVERRVRLVERFPGFTGRDLSLLDIGCGNGASMFLLSDRMKNCEGIEISDAHRPEFDAYKREHHIANCTFRVEDVTTASPDTTYDRIISFEVIEHLSDENRVSYYYDALKAGGLMAVSVPNKWWIFETHGANLPLLPWNRVPFFSWLPRPVHERFANARIYTKKRISRLLEKQGFRVLETKYIMAPLDVLKESAFKRLMVRWFFKSDTTTIPIKSTSILVIATKPS
jgi:2-polyprenyl-3-methyl-5-hydroxy-6-metoxy-1,4-benzoquinol methylase